MHKNTKDLTGMKFGKWKVLSLDSHVGSKVSWLCECECGMRRVVISSNLISGKSKSCGCGRTIHGNSKKPEYSIWYSMIDRCANKNHKFWNRYGGRGITVCKEWLSFATFIGDMGDRPSKDHQLDRIDNECGYFVENCRWVLSAENVRNRGDSKYWHVNGTRYDSMRQAAKSEGVVHSTIKNWCKKGINGCYSERKYDAK